MGLGCILNMIDKKIEITKYYRLGIYNHCNRLDIMGTHRFNFN
ncbi:hypothetical protein SAMN05444148_0277 [Winogradskyella jejuensis]|uniref:Uncharacterized protein n=1 Tax=Winogradskyella jejuensis TaxID=1089305 RepID=A0A1M5KB37_9FLAO|nr:hypothetical protein SAMN05444148_0277 [Winogradskyella jejuensis]